MGKATLLRKVLSRPSRLGRGGGAPAETRPRAMMIAGRKRGLHLRSPRLVIKPESFRVSRWCSVITS